VSDDLEATSAPTIDAAHYRSVLGHFCTGITIVTTVADGEPAGFTCVSFTSVSLDPPLVAFLAQTTSSTLPKIRSSGVFCVNVLSDAQETICRSFAAKAVDKFQGIGWRPGATGSPVLSEVLASIDCTVEAEQPAGDHILVLGRVVEMDAARQGQPLLFYRGGYGRFEA